MRMKNYEIHSSPRYVKDGQHLHMLGQKMEDLIFTVADTNFFFNDLEDCDQVRFHQILIICFGESCGIKHFIFWLVKTNLKEFTGKRLLWNLSRAVWVFYFEILRLAEASDDTWYHQLDNMTFWSDQIYVVIFLKI